MVSARCQRKRDERPLLLFGLEMGLGEEIRRHLYNGTGLKGVERVTVICCAAAASRNQSLRKFYANKKDLPKICMTIGLKVEILAAIYPFFQVVQ